MSYDDISKLIVYLIFRILNSRGITEGNQYTVSQRDNSVYI